MCVCVCVYIYMYMYELNYVYYCNLLQYRQNVSGQLYLLTFDDGPFELKHVEQV